MNRHPLVELAYMHHEVCIVVVNGESWLLESIGERGSLNTTCEWRPGELVQGFTHGVVPHAPWRGTSTLALLVTLLLVGESLAWGSLGSLPVVVVIFVVEGCVSAGGGGIVFVVQSAAFSLSHLSPAAWLVRRPVSGTCDYPRGCGFCWFVWYPRSLPEPFRSPRSCHAQGLGNSPAVRIWLA